MNVRSNAIPFPKAYKKPWTIEVPVRYLPDTDLIEHVCLENEKDRARLVGRLSETRERGATIAPTCSRKTQGPMTAGRSDSGSTAR